MIIRKALFWIIIVCLPIQGSLGQADRGRTILQEQELSYPVLKSSSADTVRIALTLQVGEAFDSIAIMGECANAASYVQQTTFPAEVKYQTGTVTVDNLSVLRAVYFVTIPWATPVGTYEGEVLYTISTAAGVCKVRLLMFTVTVVPTEIPVADFTGDPLTIVEGGTVSFSDLSVNPVTSWAWDFGDGNSSPDQNPQHVYEEEGAYSVSLTSGNHVGSNTMVKEAYVNVLASGTPGLKKWDFTTGLGTWSPPSIGPDGTIYLGSLEFRLYAINPDGSVKWSHQTSGAITSIAVGPDKIYCVSQNHLHAIDMSGNRLWTYPLSGNVFDLSLGVEGTIYMVVSTQPNLQAVNSNGQLEWGINIGYNSLMPKRFSLAPDGTIYLVSYSATEQLYKLNAVSPEGEIKWTRNTQANTYFNYRTSPAIDEYGSVYLGGIFNFYSIDRNGEDNWIHSDEPGEFLFEPAIGPNGDIYSVFYRFNVMSKVVSLSRDGSVNWNFVIPSHPRLLSPVTIGSDNVMYFTTEDSLLYAVNPEGTLKWTYKFDDENPVYLPAIPTIGEDGTIYVNYGMNLYAITSSGEGLADSPWPKSGQNIFNTGRRINPAPWLISPRNDSISAPVDVGLKWGSVYGDIQYDIELSLNENFTEATTIGQSTSQTSTKYNNLDLSSYYYWHVRANGIEGQSPWSPVWKFVTGNSAGIGDHELSDDLLSLAQNYPNPFNDKTVISYDLKDEGKITIEIIDLEGRIIGTHSSGLRPSGNYDWVFNGQNLDRGIYFYRLISDKRVITNKMIKL